MTREEEIHNAAMEVSNRWKRSELLPTQDEIIAYYSAVTMAKWCDNHPRKGLWDKEKVTNWVRENFEHYAYNYGIDEVIVGLTKAMEE